MQPRDRLGARQIGDGARDAQDAGEPPRGQPHRLGGLGEQRLAAAVERDMGARVPGFTRRPPPVSAAIEAEWCGLRSGRCCVSRPPWSVPATLATIDTSSASGIM